MQLCEETLGSRTTADHVKTPEQMSAQRFRLYVQQQAMAGGVQGVAGAWDAQWRELAPPPK